MAKPKLICTQEQFESLHDAVEGKRKATIPVPRQALVNLLIDHGVLIDMYDGKFKESEES